MRSTFSGRNPAENQNREHTGWKPAEWAVQRLICDCFCQQQRRWIESVAGQIWETSEIGCPGLSLWIWQEERYSDFTTRSRFCSPGQPYSPLIMGSEWRKSNTVFVSSLPACSLLGLLTAASSLFTHATNKARTLIYINFDLLLVNDALWMIERGRYFTTY